MQQDGKEAKESAEAEWPLEGPLWVEWARAPLQATSLAKRERLVTDGPFTETHELIGG
jgi:hypothetical protein